MTKFLKHQLEVYFAERPVEAVSYTHLDVYKRQGYDGILLLVNFGSGRGWYISTYGSAIDDFSDADIEKIGDNIKTYLSGGEYFAAFNKYLDMIEYPLSGKALPRKTSETFFYIGVCFVVGLVTAFVSTSVMRSKKMCIRDSMNTAVAHSDENIVFTELNCRA